MTSLLCDDTGPPMSDVQLKDQAKKLIDALSKDQLRVAAEFLAFVSTRDADPATLELLAIPGFKDSYTRGTRDIKAGRTRPWQQVRADVHR
jgi:hypothetical protein